jgi:hypothetical protein
MRVKRASGSTRRNIKLDPRTWIRPCRTDPRFRLAVMLGMMLGVALAAVVGIWYAWEGHGIAHSLLPGSFAGAREKAGTGEKNDLPALYLDITSKGYRALEKQRHEALQKGILEDGGWVRAQARFQGEAIPVYVRLKADRTDPLPEHKWPLQVRTQDGATVLGMRSFSAQSPATSGYLNQWLYLEDLRRIGILAPRSFFVNVLVNGDDWGVYALQEGISEALFASQEREGGVIVHVDGSLLWPQRVPYNSQDEKEELADAIASPFEQSASVQADEFDTIQIDDDPALGEQHDRVLGLLQAFTSRRLPAWQVFDAERMGQYLAHANLWGAQNGREWHDQWYSYNPLAARLEPIGHDAFARSPADAPLAGLAACDDVAIMEAYAREVLRISQPEYLDGLRSAYGGAFERYYVALAGEFASTDLEVPWSMLPRRQELLWNSLHPRQTVYARQVGYEPNIQVGNLLPYPVALRKVKLGHREIDIQAGWISRGDGADPYEALNDPAAMPYVLLPGMCGDVPEYITLCIPATALRELAPQRTSLYSETLQIVTSLVGVGEPVVVDVWRDVPLFLSEPSLPARPTVGEALERHPFLQRAEQPGFLELKPGTWHVEGDLVLPDGLGLRATEPVTLTFGRQAIFFSNGPLVLRGPNEGGIHFLPQNDRWGGLVVLQAGSKTPSLLHHVEICGTSGIRRGGWMASAGATFYESPVVFSRCTLRDSMAKEAVHVVLSDFECVHTRFESTAADAFDGDFAQGRIAQCTFDDVRGDGIDLSGSRVEIEDVSFSRVHGRGISAGEGSMATVENVRATDVYLAIVSKDVSSVRVRGVRIARAWGAGFAAYRERVADGTARIEVSDVVFEGDPVQFLVQEGSSAVLDGAPVPAGELDVEELDRWQEALAAMRVLGYRLGSGIRLVGYELATPELRPGGSQRTTPTYLPLTLYWQSLARVDRDYTVFIHVLDALGQVVVGWDHMPRQDAFPTTRWEVGELVADTHWIPLPPDLPAGEYRISVGMYDFETGERLPVRGPAGEDLPNAALVLEQAVRVVH